jgi:hypothetical protein
MRPRRPLGLALLFLAAILGARFAQAAEPTPLGYERWTDAPASEPFFSNVLFDHDVESLYGSYTNELELFSTGKKGFKPQASHRLIDVDRVYIDETGKPRLDAVWIKNVGDFKTNSWLLYDLTAADVQLVASLPNAFILDIESYGKEGDLRYMIILRDNPKKFAYVVFTDATTDDTVVLPNGSEKSLHEMFDDRKNWRATDIDVRAVGGEYFDWPQFYDSSMTRYNAVFVTNLGQNHKETVVLEGDNQTIIDYAGYGMQLVDFEDNSWKVKHYWPNRPHLMIFVGAGQPFFLSFDLATSEAAANLYDVEYFYDVEKMFSRCIDIETHPYGGKTKDAVFLP